MIGIILWAILIIFIVICACPGFITALITITAIVLTAYFGFAWLITLIKKRIKKCRAASN